MAKYLPLGRVWLLIHFGKAQNSICKNEFWPALLIKIDMCPKVINTLEYWGSISATASSPCTKLGIFEFIGQKNERHSCLVHCFWAPFTNPLGPNPARLAARRPVNLLLHATRAPLRHLSQNWIIGGALVISSCSTIRTKNAVKIQADREGTRGR